MSSKYASGLKARLKINTTPDATSRAPGTAIAKASVALRRWSPATAPQRPKARADSATSSGGTGSSSWRITKTKSPKSTANPAPSSRRRPSAPCHRNATAITMVRSPASITSRAGGEPTKRRKSLKAPATNTGTMTRVAVAKPIAWPSAGKRRSSKPSKMLPQATKNLLNICRQAIHCCSWSEINPAVHEAKSARQRSCAGIVDMAASCF
mmetsp:Transcript_87091/g.138171  ORF Transcript_87091/g.138171 Transcript_87091/m.138171 type:complete len:210 (-) Transcript_87091:466-1095(-)